MSLSYDAPMSEIPEKSKITFMDLVSSLPKASALKLENTDSFKGPNAEGSKQAKSVAIAYIRSVGAKTFVWCTIFTIT